MASERQFDANRRNARKSTGPRTCKGKAQSSKNSLKHGLLAESALLPDEDEGEYRDFANEGIRELDPRGWLESVRAGQIVDQAWRCRRPARVEAGLFTLDRGGARPQALLGLRDAVPDGWLRDGSRERGRRRRHSSVGGDGAPFRRGEGEEERTRAPRICVLDLGGQR